MVENKGMFDIGGFNMPKLIDLTGKKFGRLTVLKRSPENINRKPAWVCQCECGNIKIVRGSDLKEGKTKSCGCLQKEVSKNRSDSKAFREGMVFGYLTVIKDLGLK